MSPTGGVRIEALNWTNHERDVQIRGASAAKWQ